MNDIEMSNYKQRTDAAISIIDQCGSDELTKILLHAGEKMLTFVNTPEVILDAPIWPDNMWDLDCKNITSIGKVRVGIKKECYGKSE